VYDDGKNFTGNPAFDAQYSVTGAPREVLRQLITPQVQAYMLALGTQLRFDAACVECQASGAHDEARARAVLQFADWILRSLPQAIRAGGAEPFLVGGTLANHPEVASKRRSNRVAVVVLLLIAISVPMIVVALVVYLIIR
jgi:hypothetical protein